MIPDLNRCSCGREAGRTPAWRASGAWLDWLQPWPPYHVRIEGLIDAGNRVVVFGRYRGRRRDMEAEVELISGSVSTVRDARLAPVEFCGDRAEALELAGLSE